MSAIIQQRDLSLAFGPQSPPLWSTTLGELIEKQAADYGSRPAVSFPWQGVRLSYQQLANRSQRVGRSIRQVGLHKDDNVGIIAGNCYQYIEVFLGSGRIGCPVVVLNNTYTPQELLNAIVASQCKMLFIATSIGSRSLEAHLRLISTSNTELQKIVLLSEASKHIRGPNVLSYTDLISDENRDHKNDYVVEQRQTSVNPGDVLNLQFTSGTTGIPKAAMLSHASLLNDGRFVGDRMMLTPADVICCPPPLFHCFGLVLGFIASFTHGSKIVFPSDHFDPHLVLDAIVDEGCTALLSVPTMFLAEMEANLTKKYTITTVRTGLAAGAPVPQSVMNRLESEMGIKGMLIAYGMTETSPVTIMTSLNDSPERRVKTIGTVIPHTGVKIINRNGFIVPRGVRGEICTSGFSLQRGYWKNEQKTQEVMKRDENNVLWMHTGDEGILDEDGYVTITGRIKDIIIRGGENIFPIEIEERLLAHPSIEEASVIGVPDRKYGEVVGCFLRQANTTSKPPASEVSDWVKQKIGKHKAPQHIWWIGDAGVGDDFPKTGSGKHQKHILRDLSVRLLKSNSAKPRL